MAETAPKANIEKRLSHKPGRPSVSAGLFLTITRYILFVPLCAIPLAYTTPALNVPSFELNALPARLTYGGQVGRVLGQGRPGPLHLALPCRGQSPPTRNPRPPSQKSTGYEWHCKGYLNDCIPPACPERGRRNGTADQSLRPNQIFAVSLTFSPLSARQQTAVAAAVQERLLTPYGLRTLSPEASGYKGRYTGPLRQRDEAYHQGTVWPYLIGPFVEAYLKVNEFSAKSRKQAAEFIEPLLQHLTETGCLGSISEIFDGDPPHQPKGCIAQAWSVAELIRACQLIWH